MIRLFYVVLFLTFTHFLWATPVLMESIAAIVDGKPIMRSELLNHFYQFKNSPEAQNMSETEQMSFVLNHLIDEKVLLSRVSIDSIVVADEEVDQRVSMHLTSLAASQNIDLATLEKAIQNQLGISMAQYREQLSKQIRDHILVTRIRQLHVGVISPTKKEVLAFYEAYKDSLPKQYNCISVSHLQLKIEANPSIVDSVEKKALMLIDSLDQGVHWDVLTKNHSQDSLKEKGGDLGFVRKGLFEPAYERALERLKNGEYTEKPVKTSQGFHIIRLVGRKENATRSAHILLKVQASKEDSLKVLSKADSIRSNIHDKKSFALAAKKWSEDLETNFKGGDLGWFQRNEFDSNYVQTISRLSVGEISEPVLIDDSYHLFRLDDEREVRELNIEEDYQKIEALAASQMENKKLQAFVQKWRQEVHIEVRHKE
mgnify:CR=1 FL=1|jgi:peptidyl-prolyl cis-trans isomerase SurA